MNFASELERVAPEEQVALLKRLAVYAERRLSRRNLVWLNRRGRRGDGPEHAEDVVGDAFQKALSGERAWNQKKYPDIERFLRSVIRSMVNHELESAENKQTVKLNPPPDEPDADPLAALPCEQTSVAERLAHEETLAMIRDAVEGDEDLECYLMAVEEGYTKRSEAAAAMGVSLSEYDNIKKRFARKIEHTRL